MLENKIFKRKICLDNYVMQFVYEGKEKKDNINYDNIDKLLNNVFDNRKGKSIIDIVLKVRTILKDFDEEFLRVDIYDNIFDSNYAIYKNRILEDYGNSLSNNKINITYNKKRGFLYNINYEKMLEKRFNQEEIKLLDEELDTIDYLNNVNINGLKMDRDDKILYELYKEFYQEIPDYSEPDINIKFQAMMFLLEKYGINIEDINFEIYYKDKFPRSRSLEIRLYDLSCLGKVESVEDPIILSKYAIKKAHIVGASINEYINKTDNPIETLKHLCTVDYVNVYNLGSNATPKRIAKYVDFVEEEVKKHHQLIKKIDEKRY